MKASNASTIDSTISRPWVTKRRFRLLCRSAMAPAPIEKSRSGPYWAAMSSPMARPLWVRCSTSSVRATVVSQLPVLEIVCPMKNSRKFRVRRDPNVLRTVARSRFRMY